jgi:hypothetical protein
MSVKPAPAFKKGLNHMAPVMKDPALAGEPGLLRF